MAIRSIFAMGLIASCLYAAEAHWIRLKSANFEMYTTANERYARETLRNFERVRAFFAQGMGNIPGKQLPVRIIAFSSKKEYEPYRLNDFSSAYYHATPTTDEIVLSETGAGVFPVAVHEYVHLVVRHMGLKLPPWLGEGMAELYSTLKPTGDRVLVGTLIEGRHQALLLDKWVPLHTIVTADQNSPYYNERNQAGSLYNEGWALTHMLVLTNEYRPGFEKFMQMVSAGTPTEEALAKVYGKTIEQVDKELQAYLRGTHFQGAYFAQKLEQANGEIRVEPASDFEVKLALADLLDRPGKDGAARKAMEELVAEDPKRPEPFVALGYLALRARDREEAAKNFEKAFELGGRDPAMLLEYGRILRGRDPERAIRVLLELVAREPSRTDARLELAAEQLIAKQPGAALDTLKPVQNVAPEETPRWLGIMAHAQLDLRQWSEARQTAERLKQAARSDEDRYQADRVLEFLDATEQPALRRREESVDEQKSVAGMFSFFDCSGTPRKIVIETEQGQKVFLIDDPHKVLGDPMEQACGTQKNQERVRVDYVPANQAGADGLVRGFRLEP